VRADGDVVAGEKFDDLDLPGATFELDHLGPALLHEPHGVLQRLLARGVRHERHVGHQERAQQAPRHGLAVIDDVIERDGHGRVVALDHHAERVTDQHDVGARFVHERGEAGVVTGETRDFLALGLHAAERSDVDGRAGRVPQLELCVHGAASNEAARMTERPRNINAGNYSRLFIGLK
jgi:hypothetical protein